MSPIDELYLRLMGTVPSKNGTAYEIISAAVLGLVLDDNAQHNVFIKGLSETTYQLDGLINGTVMVESKDYTLQEKKVGRSDLQKMQGALTDLPDITKGIFTSATEYTTPAIKYANASGENQLQKEIYTANIREVNDSDMRNRIQSFEIHMNMIHADYRNGKYSLIFFNDAERTRFHEFLKDSGQTELHTSIYQFYDVNGNVCKTMVDLSLEQQPVIDLDNVPQTTKGRFNIDAYVKLSGNLYRISGISYDMPVVTTTETFTVKANGEATMLVQSDKLGIDKVITDTDLCASIKRVLNNE